MKALILFMTLLSLAFAKQATVEQLFNVQTVQVKELSKTKTMKSFGYLKVDDAKVYDVTPRYSGYVETLYADKMYQQVNAGETLAKVYSPEVLKAKEDYLNTIKYTKIHPNRVMLQSAKEKLQLLNVPDNEISSIKDKDRSSNYTKIIAPQSGYIFSKNINQGSAFKQMQKIFQIVNIDKLWVEVKIHQNQLKILNEVKEFQISTPAYSQSFSAQREQLYPSLDPKEEAFTLRLEVSNKEHLLLPGMYATVAMQTQKESYLTLPATAVIRKNATYYVFSVGEFEGEYEPKEVSVEMLDPDTYIIKSGLQAGDKVVNNALFMMDSDAQINGLY